MMSIDGMRMSVRSTDPRGVVGAETTLLFTQHGSGVCARYSGGRVERGCLVGKLVGTVLSFRYAQREASGEIHWGQSVCDVTRQDDRRIRIVEHFSWGSRDGSGTNVFEEIVDDSRASESPD